jgi:hypothetical protein
MSSKDVRSAILGIGIIFCIGLLAMTAVVVAGLEVRQWNLSFLLLGAFIVFGVAIIGMILVALISALRNPPDE